MKHSDLSSFRSTINLLQKVYFLVRPYGLKKLVFVFLVSLTQGIFQVIGVTSIFPFLALASNPDPIRHSEYGSRILEMLPPMDNSQLLVISGILAVLLLLLANTINLLAEFVRNRYGQNFAHWLRLRLINQIMSQPYGYFLGQNAAIMQKKATVDVLQFTTEVLLPLLDSFSRIVTIVLLGSFLFWVNAGLAFGALILLGGFYILIFVLLNNRRRLTVEGLKKANRGLSKETLQSFTGIKPVKVHAAEQYFLDRVQRPSSQQARLMSWIPVYTNGPRYMIEPIAFGGLVIYVVVLAAHGRSLIDVLPVISIIALAGYRLLPALQMLYGQLTQVNSRRDSLDEVFDELMLSAENGRGKTLRNTQTKDGSKRTPLTWGNALHLENIIFSYPESKRNILENVTLNFKKGSSTAIIGETGSGKSTLVDILLGLHTPTGGRILVDDVHLTEKNLSSWQSSIGYVPQEIFLLDDTVARNIAFGIPDDQIDVQRLKEVCRISQILSFIEKDLPRGFETEVGDRGVRLSGGQRQRIGLARALYHNPTLLVLDEATSALDETTEKAMVDAINSLQGKITMIVIAHRISTIEGCQFCYRIVRGEVKICETTGFLE